MLTRRAAIVSLIFAPAIVRAASLMPVRALTPTLYAAEVDWTPLRTDHYVDPNWLGPQLGTRDEPWQTLQQAVAYLDERGIGRDQITINVLGNLTFERKLAVRQLPIGQTRL